MTNSDAVIVVKANAVMSAFNIVTGQLAADKDGLNFLSNAGSGFITINWSAVEKVSVQVVFGAYWRGIYVKTPQGEFQFLTTKTKKLVDVISQFIDKEKIVRRRTAWERK